MSAIIAITLIGWAICGYVAGGATYREVQVSSAKSALATRGGIEITADSWRVLDRGFSALISTLGPCGLISIWCYSIRFHYGIEWFWYAAPKLSSEIIERVKEGEKW